MVLCAAEPKKDMLLIRRNVQWLEDESNQGRPAQGRLVLSRARGGDNSNSQFAVLALYDAQRVGVEVSRETWQLAADYWRSTQNDDGSWGYVPGDAGTGSMTCAGIGGLAISTAALESGDAAVENGRVDLLPAARRRRQARPRHRLAGRPFLRESQSAPGRRRPVVPLLLSLRPRAGRPAHGPPLHRRSRLVSRRAPSSWSANRIRSRTIGKATWYAEQQSAHQHRDGAVVPVEGSPADRHGQAASTATATTWNQHRRDAAHLTEYTEEAWDLGLTWQVMDPAKATVEDLLQAPVLYISGSQAPNLLPSRAKAARLRRSRRLHLRRSLLRRFAAVRRQRSAN